METTETQQEHAEQKKKKNGRRSPRVLLGVTGSVAAVKAPEIACRLVDECGAHVKILLSEGGRNFWEKAFEYDPVYWNRLQELLQQQQAQSQPQQLQVIAPDDEWKAWRRLGDPVLHIDLRDWADLLLLAPLSAHTLAKLAHGLCDDTLSCVARAWDFGHYQPQPQQPTATSKSNNCNNNNNMNLGKPVLLAPAMNTAMWEHPLTQQQLQTIQSFAGEQASSLSSSGRGALVQIIAPQSKLLACGEVGVGALASVDEILQSVRNVVGELAL